LLELLKPLINPRLNGLSESSPKSVAVVAVADADANADADDAKEASILWNLLHLLQK
jgi:hypothetical protein